MKWKTRARRRGRDHGVARRYMASGHEVDSEAILIGKRWLSFGNGAGRVTKCCANRCIRLVLPPDIGGEEERYTDNDREVRDAQLASDMAAGQIWDRWWKAGRSKMSGVVASQLHVARDSPKLTSAASFPPQAFIRWLHLYSSQRV